MNYNETIDYLFTRLPMFSRIGAAAIKADLTNTIALCEALGNPHHRLKTIHVAGTNGKGSTSHMLAAILQTAGYKTGLYTSPHLHDFRERIRVNGQMVTEDYVTRFVQRIQPLIHTIEPSFFEITVAMAFDYFVEQEVDIAVIETGLGGRLDSTNIISPDLSVITNIGYDHMNILGDTLQLIAAEKAGIIKPNVPAIIGEFDPTTAPVFQQKAREAHTSLTFASHELLATDWHPQGHHLVVEVTQQHSDNKNYYELDLPGIYQAKNLLTVLQSIHQLRHLGYHIPEEALHTALKNVRHLTGLHGRWQLIHEHPTVILDVAHNEAGLQQLNRQLETTSFHQLHIIIGMVRDKEVGKALALLPTHATYYFTKAQIPRALPETELAGIATSVGLSGQCYSEVNQALENALAHAHKDDLILVCGSVFLVAEVDPVALRHKV